MAISTGNIVQEAIAELQTVFTAKGVANVSYESMSLIFKLGVDIEPEDVTWIASYLDALSWTQEVRILWREARIILDSTTAVP